MNTNKNQQKSFTIAVISCLLIRLIPLRAPNVEPILAVQMPFAKAYGRLTGFFFGVSSIVLYDTITHTLGIWTVATAGAYGILGLCASRFFQNRTASRKNFVTFAVFATLLYDALTGLTIGPLFFKEPLWVAFVGQIPFTALHLFGNILFAYLISPALYATLVRYQRPQHSPLTVPLLEKPMTL